MSASGQAKRGYHHGDLRNALIAAAGQLAEQGGPAAVTVRAAAKAVGVTPTAAYRHFENHEKLIEAAKRLAMGRMTGAMRERVAMLPVSPDPVRHAMGVLGSVALGYIHFATTEPGLFRTVFQHGSPQIAPEDDPFTFLVEGLDKLVEVGHLAAEDRPMAEMTAWSAVHGFSMLTIEGPMGEWEPEMVNAALERMLSILTRGMSAREVDDQLVADVLADVRISNQQD
nr:TetR/AcrR family transcriptional regulator [Kibdelosporangium sp. MJ126-NF4]